MLSLKQYLFITSGIFFFVGLLHAIRLIFALGIVIAGFSVPLWCSIVGVVAAWYLSFCAFKLAKKKK